MDKKICGTVTVLVLCISIAFFGCSSKSLKADITITSDFDYAAVFPEQLSENASHIVYGEFLGDETSYMMDSIIMSSGSFRVEQVLKGELPSDKINLGWMGGMVTLAEYTKNRDAVDIKKAGLDQYSISERSVKTIEFTGDTLIKPEVGQKYLCFLYYDAGTEIYYTTANAYSMRRDDGTGRFWNLDTQEFEPVSMYNDFMGGRE